MPYLAVRDPLADAKDTLSSWDKCMAKSYCKWPVIVAIVVGGLILLSAVFCVARCVCCGAELACCCCKCCSCCCPSGGGRSGHKRVKSDSHGAPAYPPPYQPPGAQPSIDTRPVHQQYRSHAAPTFNPAPARAPVPERPRFATFDTSSKPVNEDSLPAMPRWSEAKDTHVEEIVMPEKRDDVEMDRLNHNGSVTGSVTGTAVSGGLGVASARRSPGPPPIQRTPTGVSDPYGFPAGYQNDSFANSGPRRSPGPGAMYAQQEGYRGVSPVQQHQQQSLSPAYGAAGGAYARNQQYGRRSPSQAYDQHYNQTAPRQSPPLPDSNAYGYADPNPSQTYIDSNPAHHYTESNPSQTYMDANPAHHYADPNPSQPYMDANPAHHYADSNPSQQHYADVTSTSSAYSESFAPSPVAPIRQPSPARAPSAPPVRYQSPVAAYPGQQTYESADSGAYPDQQTYQAFNPGQSQERQYSPVQRRPVDGSWKEV